MGVGPWGVSGKAENKPPVWEGTNDETVHRLAQMVRMVSLAEPTPNRLHADGRWGREPGPGGYDPMGKDTGTLTLSKHVNRPLIPDDRSSSCKGAEPRAAREGSTHRARGAGLALLCRCSDHTGVARLKRIQS